MRKVDKTAPPTELEVPVVGRRGRHAAGGLLNQEGSGSGEAGPGTGIEYPPPLLPDCTPPPLPHRMSVVESLVKVVEADHLRFRPDLL